MYVGKHGVLYRYPREWKFSDIRFNLFLTPCRTHGSNDIPRGGNESEIAESAARSLGFNRVSDLKFKINSIGWEEETFFFRKFSSRRPPGIGNFCINSTSTVKMTLD